MTELLIKLLPLVAPAIRYADDPRRSYWRIDLLIYSIFVWLADMALAALFFHPQKNELTISHTLERTALTNANSRQLALAINRISPNHIKAVL
jgi:hypothetical protein